MKPPNLRDTLRSFLELVEGPPEPVAESAQELALLLDRLALATHAPVPSDPATDLEAPDRKAGELRAAIAPRFPHFGLYRAAGTEPEDELLVGDAIDDLTDIALELGRVAWLWDHAGESAALWQFHFTFRSHWGAHLRGLQWYVHELEY